MPTNPFVIGFPGISWGQIAGDITDQSDIQTILDGLIETGEYIFFLEDDADPVIGGYKVMDNPAQLDTEAYVTQSTVADGQLIQAWATASGLPGVTFIPGGVWRLYCNAYKTGGTKETRLYAEVYKRNLAGTETLLGTTADSIILTDTEVHLPGFSILVAEQIFLDTDRIVIKAYIRLAGGGSNPTSVSIGYAGTTSSRVTIPAQAVDVTQFVRRTGDQTVGGVKTFTDSISASNLSGTNTGDNAVNTLYSGLVSNATHTGDATGATALAVVKIQGKDFPTLSGADDQKYPKYVSASNAFVMTAIAGGGDVTGDDVSTTAQNIVAYSGAAGKNITELTGTQGDVLYHNGTSWAKLGAGTLGQFLITGGAGANPSWGYGAIVHSSKSAGATTTGANVTPVSVTDAVFTYAANAVYRIWVMGRINSTAATTGGAIQFDLSSAVTAIDVFGGNLLASTGTATFFAGVADDTTLGTGSSGVPAGPVDVPIHANALLVTGANTGTCQLRFRSEVAAVTELMAGTVMVVERVA